MKKLKSAISLLLALVILILPLTGCGEPEGDVLEITVDTENGEKTYPVSYDFYRTIFIYLKNIITNVVEDSEGNVRLATDEEKTKAIKETAEDTLVEFYSLVSFAADYGISITEEDKAAFQANYREKLQSYIDAIDEENFDFKGTREEYAQTVYENSLRLLGTTPEYYEFSYYRSLLISRLKAVIGGDLSGYLDQSYTRYKQVIVLYAKGDAVAEEEARNTILAAQEKLAGGADIDDVIAEYGEKDHQSEVYFDSHGSIVGSLAGDSLNSIVVNAICALEEGDISDIMSGDESERIAYFAIYQKLPFDMDYICSEDGIAEAIYEYPYVDSASYSPHYSRYLLLMERYTQNTAIVPYDVKAYNKISVKNID